MLDLSGSLVKVIDLNEKVHFFSGAINTFSMDVERFLEQREVEVKAKLEQNLSLDSFEYNGSIYKAKAQKLSSGRLSPVGIFLKDDERITFLEYTAKGRELLKAEFKREKEELSNLPEGALTFSHAPGEYWFLP